MTQSHAPSTAFAGLDVGKAACQLAILLPDGSVLQRAIDTTPEGFADMVQLCRDHQVSLVVMEYTGRLELLPALELWAARIPLSIISPRQSKSFARALNREAKTDRLDAELLARFAQKVQPQPMEKPSPHQLELQELATRRRQLTAMVVQEKNRLAQARLKNLRRGIRKSLAFLVRMIRDVDKQISQHIQDDPQRKIMVEQLETVPGISSVSAQQLIIALPEIGTLTRRKIASLAGLAPFARDSGGSTGQRSIRGGRRYARNALFMPTMCAIRHNPMIKEMYQRLLAAGKRRMVALVACMRKLLILLNSMVKQSKNWEQFLKNTKPESTPVLA